MVAFLPATKRFHAIDMTQRCDPAVLFHVKSILDLRAFGIIRA